MRRNCGQESMCKHRTVTVSQRAMELFELYLFLPFLLPSWDFKALANVELQSTDKVPRLQMCLPCFIWYVSSDQLEGSLVLESRWLHFLHLCSHHPNSKCVWGLAKAVENQCWGVGGLGKVQPPPGVYGHTGCAVLCWGCDGKRLTVSKSLSCLAARAVWQASVVAFGGFSDLCFPCHHHWFKKT